MASPGSDPCELELAEFAQQVPFLDASSVRERVLHVWKKFKSKGVDLSKPCSGSDAAGCWILDCLDVCNKILCLVGVQIVECRPGELSFCRNNCFIEFCSEDAVLDSTFLICWLLKYHPCIQAIEIADTSLFANYPSVVKLALSMAANVKSIGVGTCDATPQHNAFLSKFPRCAGMLERLEIFRLALDHNAATQLSNALSHASRLKSLVLHNDILSRSSRDTLYESLQNCTQLTSLEICDCRLTERAARHLAVAVLCAKSLKDLTLLYVPDVSIPIVLKAVGSKLKSLTISGCSVAEGLVGEAVATLLRTNHSIETVKLKTIGFTGERVKVLADALRVNQHLRKLSFQNSNLDDVGMETLAEALKQNRALEYLDVRGNLLTPASLPPFLEALSVNNSLKLVRLGTIYATEDDEGGFPNGFTVTQNMQFCHRISTSWDGPCLRELARIVKADEDVEKLHLEFTEPVPEIKLLLLALCTNTHVTELHLDTSFTPDPEIAAVIASVLETSRSLKIVSFSPSFDESPLVVTVLGGLKNSKSIVSVKFWSLPLDLTVAKALSAVFKVNSTINTFKVKTAFVEQGVYKLLAKCLRTNYTLWSFQVGDHQEGTNKNFFDVLQTTRRNRLLVNRAVRFVLNTCRDEDCREAFRMLCKSDSLEQQLSTVTGMSRTDARQCIEAAVSLVSSEKC